MNYKDLNDYELLSMIPENEAASDALYEKYKPLIYKVAKKLYKKNTGLDFNDLLQEGNIGLAGAIRYYDDNKNAMFFTYAKTCIEKKIISYIVGTKRQKHRILNESISMEAIDESDSLNGLDKIVKDSSLDPENIVVFNENESYMYQEMKKVLTDFELSVLELRYYGFEYKEIAKLLDKDIKAVDNAVQRIRFKAKKMK